MKRFIIFSAVFSVTLAAALPAFAQTTSDGVTQIQGFLKGIIDVLLGLAGTIAVIFIVIGGFRYMTSTGNPDSLEKAKKTLLYAAIGLAISLGAFVLMNMVTQLATKAFGTAQ